MDFETFYNQEGEAVAYADGDGRHIWSFDGEALGYLDRNGVYNYNGTFCGWYEGGCLWDLNGDCALFTQQAKKGPVKPVRIARPARAVKEVRPVKSAKERRPVRPAHSVNWSKFIGVDVFKGMKG